MSKTGRVIKKGKKFSLVEALPTHRAYSTGYTVGVKPLKSLSPKGTAGKNFKDVNKK